MSRVVNWGAPIEERTFEQFDQSMRIKKSLGEPLLFGLRPSGSEDILYIAGELSPDYWFSLTTEQKRRMFEVMPRHGDALREYLGI